MLCQDCHKNVASVRYAEVVDGHVTEQHLCASCLDRRQERPSAGFQLDAPGLGRAKSVHTAVRDSLRAGRTCSFCGALLSTVTDSLRVGCATCYREFSSPLDALIQARHGAQEHRGKAPNMDDARERLRADLLVKRSLLHRVLQSENYEEAAILRDEIRGIEKGLYASEQEVG